MYLKGVGAVGDHILRRVDRQYKTEADDILQDHRHTDDVDARGLKMLQDGNDDRYDRCSKACRTGKAHMDNYEEQGHDRQDHDRGRVFEPEANYDLIGHPGSGPVKYRRQIKALCPSLLYEQRRSSS